MKLINKITTLVVAFAVVLSMAAITLVKAQAGATEGTFTVAAMNVDGLPQKILGVSLNPDGPGSDGTKKISQKVAEKGWDFFAVSEDFNYHTELMSGLTGYTSGTHRGKVSGLSNNTDGLNLIWKNSLKTAGESWIAWKVKYSSGIFNTGNGADHMIDKGYRFYQVTVAEGVVVDVYILHMDAASDAQDIAAREAELDQLATAIKNSDNKNPIIVMGDTNCRYTREKLKTGFIDVINADARFTISDCWIEKCKNGEYPAYGSASLMVGDLGYVEGEIVDKMFYINNSDSDVELVLNTFKVDTNFNDTDGTPLADHYPVVGEFTYRVKNAPHEHSYTSEITKAPTCTEDGVKTFTCSCGDSYTEPVASTGHNYTGAITKAPTCTEAGVKTYTCDKCGDSYTEAVASTGHNYVDGVCGNCGEADPNVNIPGDDAYIRGTLLGNEITVDELKSGQQYAIFFHSTYSKYPLISDGTTIDTEANKLQPGDLVTDDLIWTLTKTANGGWTISKTVDGKEVYFSCANRTNILGCYVSLSDTPWEWNIMNNGYYSGVRISTKATNKRTYYLRVYNEQIGWFLTTRSAGIHLYEIEVNE